MKNLNSYIITACIICLAASSHAQNDKKHHNIRLGVEAGTDFFFGNPRKPDMVRENISFPNNWADKNKRYLCPKL